MIYNKQDKPNNLESYRERITNFSSDFELWIFLFLIRKSFKIFLLVFVFMAMLVFAYLRYTQPVYQSEALMQIKIVDQAEQFLDVYSGYNEGDKLKTEVELIRSPLLIKKTISAMPLEIGYFTKGNLLEDNKYSNNSFRVYDFEIKDSSIYGQKFFIEKTNDAKFELLTEKGEKILDSPVSENNLFELESFAGRIEIISPAQFEGETDSDRAFFKFQSVDVLMDEILNGLDVNVANPGANTIQVQLKHNNAHFASEFINELLKQYNDYVIDRKGNSSENVLSYIEAQKDSVEIRLKQSEKMIQVFRNTNDLKGTPELSNSYLEQLTELEKSVVELEVEADALEQIEIAVLEFTTTTKVDDIIPILIGRSFESTLQGLIVDLKNKVDERRTLLATYTLDNNKVKQTDKIIAVQINLILKAIKVVKDQNNVKVESVNNKIQLMKGQLFTLPEKELELTRLNRILEINNKYFTLLLEKETEYRLSSAGITTQSEILTPAEVSTNPISPNKKLVYILGLVGSLIVCFFIVLIRYILHDKVTTLHEITKLSHASIGILGIIPKFDKKIPVSQLIIADNPKSMISESFRSIRANLQFISSKEGPKTIGITSTISGEGKTFIALNLAGIMAFSSKKVIVIDLDMRKPKIHRGFNVENRKGMSTLLIGKDSINSCIQKSTLEGLDFITAGPIPPNPSELILNGEIFDIIEELKKTYDRIIIDNPPVGLVIDGMPIIQSVDYPIYVFRSEYSKKNFVQNVDRLMNENGIKNLSVILNDVDAQVKARGGYYGYGYGYGYGSGSYGGYYSNESKTRWNKFKTRFSKK